MGEKKSEAIPEEIKTAILSGKETKRSRMLRRNPWENALKGILFAQGIYEAEDELKRARVISSSQRTVRDRYVQRIRETALRVSPEQMLDIGREFFNEPAASLNLIFGTRRGQMEEGVKIVKLFTDAKRLLPPFTEDEDRDNTALLGGLGIGMMFGCLVEMSLSQFTFTWDNFLEGTAKRNPRAMKSWETLLFVHGSTHGFSWIKASEAERFFEPASKRVNLEAMGRTHVYLNGDLERCIAMPIPDSLYEQTSQVLLDLTSAMERDQQSMWELVSRFREKRQEIDFLEQGMWEDIVQRPKYGLRAAGDRVNLSVHGLKSNMVEYQSLVLSPVGSFPEAQVKFWVRHLENPMSTTFTFAPSYFSRRREEYWGKAAEPMRVVDEILHFIALHCYWEIVMGRAGLTGINVQARVQSQRARLRQQGLRTYVRPHFRRLVSGRQSSQEALEHAREALGVFHLPPGITFVREHERGWQTMAEIPPVFVYTEKHFQAWWQL